MTDADTANLRASLLREELSRAKHAAFRIREAARDYLADAEQRARRDGQPPTAYDGRPGHYPSAALALCEEAMRCLQRRPADAEAYCAWALAYNEVARYELEGDASHGLYTELAAAAQWLRKHLERTQRAAG